MQHQIFALWITTFFFSSPLARNIFHQNDPQMKKISRLRRMSFSLQRLKISTFFPSVGRLQISTFFPVWRDWKFRHFFPVWGDWKLRFFPRCGEIEYFRRASPVCVGHWIFNNFISSYTLDLWNVFKIFTYGLEISLARP